MSLFRRSRRGEARSTRFPTLPFSAYSALFSQTSAGVAVSQESAIRSAAVAACVRILKTTVAMLPVDEVRVVNGTRQPVDQSPVVRRPSARVSRRAWVAQVMHALLTNGNFYGIVVAADALGRPVQVETVAPGDVAWIPKGDGVDVPHVDGQPRDLWPLGDLVHVPASAFLRPGRVVADSPVDLAREAIGTALAAERFGAQFFGDGAHPTSVAYSDQELDEAAAKRIKNAIYNAQHGSRETLVMGSGIKLEQMQVNPSDSQFLDLLRFEVEQACRFWGVPPQMVYAAVSGQNVTYANVNQADLQYLKYSVANWLADIEDAWSSWLADPNVVKFNVNALLRMDTPTRFKSYETALRGGWMSVNEVRTLEDQPRISDGDQYLWPPWRQFPLPESDADPDEDDA